MAQHAASQSGLAPDLLKKMLPMLAMLVAGYLAKRHSTGATVPASSGGGGLGGLLGGLFGGHGDSSNATSGGGFIRDLLDVRE